MKIMQYNLRREARNQNLFHIVYHRVVPKLSIVAYFGIGVGLELS